jgi:TolB-like protein
MAAQCLQLRLLGGFEARSGSGATVDIGAKKTRALFAYLALSAGRAHPREKLATLLWSHRGDKQAYSSLRQALVELGRAFDTIQVSPLIKRQDTIAIDPAAVEVDATMFERLAAGNDLEDLRKAARLYGGDLLDGIGVRDPVFEEWLLTERQRVRNLALTALRRLLAAERGQRAVAVAQRLLTLDPLQEESHRALMRLHAEAGEIGLALRQYEFCREILNRELNVAPSPETEALRREIRLHPVDAMPQSDAETPEQSVQARAPVLALPDKPSIAVLPFVNMSDDPEQEYFADGVVEELITALSRFRHLFVIARNSSFTYKGRSVDVKQIGHELGVRYVLEGSVRKAANRVRIAGQLVDAATGVHLWADRFEGPLEDIFDLQDQVTASVVGEITPKLEQAEIERSKRKPTENLNAYDYYLRGIARVHRWTREDNDEALRLFHRAIELDSDFAAAYGMAARCYVQRKGSGWVTNRAYETEEAKRLARRAVELGKDDAVALYTAGMALAYVVGELEDGAALTDRALELNPNLALAWLFSGWMRVWLGQPEVAIEREARALRLSPHDPQMFNMQAATALAHFFAGRYAEALSWADMAVRGQPNFLIPLCTAAASAALSGRLAEAQRAITRLREINPALRISNLTDLITMQRPEDIDRWAEGMRKAGLPE